MIRPDMVGEKIIDILKNETISEKAVGTLKEIIVSDMRRIEEAKIFGRNYISEGELFFSTAIYPAKREEDL